MFLNSENQYGLISKIMHSVIGILFVGIIVLGYMMSNGFQFMLHKSTGLLLLFLVTLRLIACFCQKTPHLPHGTPSIMRIAAKGNIFLLYVCMFVMPITGTLMSLYNGYPIPFYGIFNVSALEKNPIANVFYEIHINLPYLFIFLICAHVVGTLIHHFVLKDDVLLKMLPFNIRKK